MLNIASLLKATINSKSISVRTVARYFSYDEALTSQTIITIDLKLRVALVDNRCLILLVSISA